MSLDHNANVYLTVTLTPSSPFYHNPSSLAPRAHSSLTHVGGVGHLTDVQVLSVPKDSWENIREDIMNILNGMEGVVKVEVQDPPRARAKRGADDL